MFRYVRSIFAVVLLTTIAFGVSGCGKDLFAPKSEFAGTIKNATQWRLYVPNPANPADVHMLDPNNYFSCYLEGSRVYHFEAKLPDGTLYAAFDARINQISRDAPVNGTNMDWCWIIGGPFYYSLYPVDGSTDAAAYTVEIDNFTTKIGKTPSTMTMTPPTSVRVMKLIEYEMIRVKAAASDTANVSLLDLINTINKIQANHSSQPMEVK